MYAIIKPDGDRSSHLAYSLNLPQEITDAQREFGLKQEGSFVISVKNPEGSAPSNSYAPPNKASYPKELQEKFGGYAWIPADPPELLSYDDAQVLFIGEDKGPSQFNDVEPLEKLDHEDEQRVAHLSGTNAVFADLRLRQTEFKTGPLDGTLE